MKTKKSNAMKKLFFSFVMLVTLVIVAGSAKAQNETTVLPGGTYTYTLKGVSSVNEATAVVTYTDPAAHVEQVSSSFTIAAGATDATITFKVTYGSQNSPATNGDILVVITDGTSHCTNSIKLGITVAPMPTYTLTIAANTNGYSSCQARTGARNNAPDATGSESNSFTYVVTPDVQNVTGTFTYSYKIDLPSNSTLTSFNNGGSGVTGYDSGTGIVTHTNVSEVTPDVFTVTFNTTTGAATQTLTATIDPASSNLVSTDGGGTYVSTIATNGNSSQSVDVNAVPTIGKFE